MAKKEIDQISGIETTGHEWDGLKELNNPLPRWWLWTFYATIAWSAVYWILMPSWPLLTDYTRGIRGHSQRAVVIEQVEALRALRAQHGADLADAALEDIQATPRMLEFAMANGRAAFGDNCAPCHGAGGAGAIGYPNLNDDDWIWGGTLDDIHQTILYGIRSGHEQARFGDMPAFGRDGLLDAQQVRAVANYVRSLSGLEVEPTADLALGRTIYEDNCASCHGDSGEGMREVGAPNLTDPIWLYGSSLEAIIHRIEVGGGGVMPAWDQRLDPVTIKSLAVYVHALGGGE
ncbi:cytochrome c oxidase cbb3-type subunit 3 [Tepidamorphus gemmatus]|uniref:Cbb3-type cytochrome c oxidase subunit n=1 Tax=Tepidamorphus gemmatus TaxID=747076 RepID=A0A4R3M9R7_9HYPH|nr:cytochrome-c oxidase, cbb3-type subunit III [Tepidamorphus gemmatus]TCT09373.1 cytochrome c oxidase cbb3-type subunit 3 [Tepidamorphus gemmatus]